MAKMSAFEKFFVNSPIQMYFHRLFGFGKFLRKLPSSSYPQILEIGSGVGFTTKLLAEKYPNAKITATDFDEDLIQIAKQKYHSNNITFQQEDATKLSFPSAYFDAVFGVLVLHHIANFPLAISEMARVVKPEGSVYIMDIPSKSFNFTHFRKDYIPGLFNKADLMDLMTRNGFSVKDYGRYFIFALEGKLSLNKLNL